MAALDLVHVGISRTAQSTNEVKAVQMHPQLGELILVPRKEIEAMLTQFFVTVEFSRDMVEQLSALERKTGLKAETLTLGRYAGVPISREAKSLEIAEGKLFIIMDVPSTLMPGQLIPVRKEIAAHGLPTASGEIFTLDQLKAAKEEFDAERASPN